MARAEKILILTFIAVFSVCIAENIPGVVQLNTGTFDKVIANFNTVLMKFEKKAVHGSQQKKMLTELGKMADAQTDFIIGFVPVTDYGEKENKELADRFGLTKEDFPCYLLFVKGKDEPIRYTGDIKSADALKRFIMKESGLWLGLPACLEEFDGYVKKFWKAEKSGRDAIIKETKEAAEKLTEEKDQERADIYVKYMEKIMEKGDDFIDSELTRVEKLSNSKVSDKKKGQLRDRASILTSFQLRLKDEL